MARSTIPRIPTAEITDETVYRERRRLLGALLASPALGLAGCADAVPIHELVTGLPQDRLGQRGGAGTEVVDAGHGTLGKPTPEYAAAQQVPPLRGACGGPVALQPAAWLLRFF